MDQTGHRRIVNAALRGQKLHRFVFVLFKVSRGQLAILPDRSGRDMNAKESRRDGLNHFGWLVAELNLPEKHA